MKSHGFNYVRLRTFVDPKAADGYDKTNGYDDIAHTVDFGKQIKDAGMGLLVDFHYSDNWADPGKQCVPVAWQGFTTIVELATAAARLHEGRDPEAGRGRRAARHGPDRQRDHARDADSPLRQRRPADRRMNHAVTGSISNWTNLGTLLKAGVAGVKEVDAGIMIALHIDRGNDLASSRNFIMNATSQGVPFDVFGESCYTAYQGQPSAWMNTFTMLASMFPNLKFIDRRVRARAARRQRHHLQPPTTAGSAPSTGSRPRRRVEHRPRSLAPIGQHLHHTSDMALYDQMKIDYASRL